MMNRFIENSLGLLRLNDLIFNKDVWSDDYAGIFLGISKEDHDIIRPVVDYLFGDAVMRTMEMPETPESPFSGDGNTWRSKDFYNSAKDYLSEKDEVNVGDDASAWVIKSFHEQIFGVSLSPEELQLFNTLQGVFVLLSSLSPKTIELLYPVLNKLLSSLAQEFIPVALGQLSQRLSDVTVIMAESMESTEVKNESMESTEVKNESMGMNEFMAMPAIMGNLENAMLGMQFMANMGDIGELNIAEELISILFKLLNATKDAYATLYSFAIFDGNFGGPSRPEIVMVPGGPSRPEIEMVRGRGHSMDHCREMLHGERENIIKAGHAVADSFFFAGGLSVPSVIEAAAGVYYGEAIEGEFDITKEMDIKLLVLEATRRFPPVLGVTYIDKATGQRTAPLPGMAGFDKSVYGEDVMNIKIRGNLEYYHTKSLNFAETAGPLENNPSSSRICPGRSMSIAMATQFIKAMQLEDYCLAAGEKIVFDEGGPTYFNEFTVTKKGKKGCERSNPVEWPPTTSSPMTVDSPSFEFVRPQNGLKGTCAWLRGEETITTKSAKNWKNKSLKDMVKKRIMEFCGMYAMFEEEVAHPIKHFCPVACEDYTADAARSMLRK